jgi:hypothetical protein
LEEPNLLLLWGRQAVFGEQLPQFWKCTREESYRSVLHIHTIRVSLENHLTLTFTKQALRFL